MSGVLKGGHEAKFIFTSGTLSPMEHQFINQNTNQHLVQPGHVWEHGRGKPQNAAFWKRAFGAKVKHRVPIASKEQIMNMGSWSCSGRICRWRSTLCQAHMHRFM